MANLTEKDIIKGVLNGTNETDTIEIDANAVTDKKITVKAGNGNDNVNIKNYYYDDLYIYAGMGSDTLTAGYGTNHLYGESGVNIFDIGNHQQDTTIYAGKGKVIIDATSISTLNDDFFAKEDMNNYFKRNGNDLVMYPRKGYGETTSVTLKDFYKNRGEYILQYEVWENSEWTKKEYDLRDLRLTTNIADLKSANYTGGRLSEIINGDARNNTIKGVGGGDAIDGGDGNDKIYGGNNSQNMLNGFDWLIGGNGNDTIYGYDGFNALEGNEGNDVIYGGKDIDIIAGGAGDDKLYGKQGENQYLYDGGTDTIFIEKDSITKLVLNDDFSITRKVKQGNDIVLTLEKEKLNGEKMEVVDTGTIILKNFFKNQDVDNAIMLELRGGNDNSKLSEGYLLPYDETHFQATGSGTIKGTVYNDDIYGSEKADKIYAYAGNDTIEAMEGNDKIYADDSYSTILFLNGDGKDTIYGGYNNLKFIDTNLSDLKYERVKDDLIIKYTDNDSVTLSEYFNGYKTNVEMIYGKNGDSAELNEILQSYNNKLEFDYGDGTVKFYSFANNDASKNHIKYSSILDLNNTYQSQKGNDLVISNFGAKNDKLVIVDYFKNGNNVTIEDATGVLGTLNDLLDYYFKLGLTEQGVPNGDFASLGNYSWKYNGVFTNDNINFGNGDDYIKTGSGHDTVYTGGGNDTVYGGTGNDYIYSVSGSKKLYGEAGNDIITTSLSTDTIYGGAGNDSISSGEYIDKIYGDKGNDNINAGTGDDIVDGGADNDKINGGAGNDLLKGGAGNDNIYGDEGNNTIYGGAGYDHIYINNATDKTLGDLVHGDADDDVISVEKGSNSKVYGDAGNDYISVSADATSNEIYGGAGNDYIRVQAQYTEVDGGAGNDIINIHAHNCEVEAGSGNDIINLAGINTNVEGGAGNDTYNFNGGIADVEDSAGNDTYIVDSLLNPTNQYIIDDSKGKDTLIINYDKEDIILNKFNVQVNQKGKIVDLDDIDVHFSADGENGSIRVEEYFSSGCIERIETADGYYITKEQMQNVAQEVAAWLVENDFYSVSQVLMTGSTATAEQQESLAFIYDNVNWQM